MILETQKREVFTSIQSKQMKIKANGIAFKVLTSSLYKNLPAAILREYGQNADNSHTRAKKSSIPFEIDLPTFFNPILRFTDYGVGMSKDFIEDNENGYLSLFSSDKRETNEEDGGFGLGKSCLLGLVDSYIIKSYYNKFEYTYNLFISSSGAPELMLISESKTERENGVIIEAAIPNNEIHNFRPNIQRIFQFFHNKPIIKCGSEIINIKEIGKAKFSGADWFIPDHNSGYFDDMGYKSSVIWCGVYGYSLDYSQIHDLTTNQKNLLKTGIVLKFDIGEISTNASRESVQIDEKTILAVKDKLNNIIIELFQNIENEIKQAKSLIEAKILWKKWYSSPEITEIKDLFTSFKFVWNNIEITDSYIRLKESIQYPRISYYKSQGLQIRETNTIDCDINLKLILIDVPESEINKRIKTLFWDEDEFINKSGYYLFKETTAKTLDMFLKEYQIEDISIIKLSTVEKWKNPNPTNYTKNSKTAAKILKWNGRKSASENSWDLAPKPKEGIYVPINRWHPVGTSFYMIGDIMSLISILDKPIELFGVKQSYSSHSLISLNDYVTNLIKNIDIKSFNIEDNIFLDCFDKDKIISKLTNIKYDGIAKQLQDKFISLNRNKNNKLSAFQSLCSHLNINPNIDYVSIKEKTVKEFDKMTKEFYDTYPMLKYISFDNWNEDFEFYINSIDLINKK